MLIRNRNLARLRTVTAAIVAVFVVEHLLSHAVGIFGFEALAVAHRVHVWLWQNPIGTALLYGSLSLHLGLGLFALSQVRSLKMPVWQIVQLTSAVAIPYLLMSHVMNTRVREWLLGVHVDYRGVVSALWRSDWLFWKQNLLMLVVWVHLCVGLHFWLRLRTRYGPVQPLLLALAVVVPLIAGLGFARAGLDSEQLLKSPEMAARMIRDAGLVDAAARERFAQLREAATWIPPVLVVLVLTSAGVRVRRLARRPRFRITHPHGEVSALVGESVLEAVRRAGLPHASVCGGRARCTTCRVRIFETREALPPPEALEVAALHRIGADPTTRLACQLRPRADVTVHPLVPASTSAEDLRRPGGVSGQERPVVIMFVDLRGSTQLCEQHFAYDVVFVLNLFFEEVSAALAETGGHYAQFAGDGLMALYGIEGGLAPAARSALLGAARIQERIEAANMRLAAHLGVSLQIGIGLHCGEAIVGDMGPPASPIVSAVGDPVNVAARLEAATKELDCTLVASEFVLETARCDRRGMVARMLPLRGRDKALSVYALQDLSELPLRLGRGG